MTTFTTRRLWFLAAVVVGALGVSGAVWSAPTPKRPIAPPRLAPKVAVTKGFYEAYLVPQMSTRFRDESAVTSAEFANAMWTPLTRDPVDEARIQKLGIRAVQGGLKRYALERLGMDAWSLPVMGRRGRDNAGPATDARGLQFHVGISRRAPRADLLIPVAAGRVVVSGDVRGRVATTFESNSSKFRLAAHVDVPERAAAVGFILRF